MKTEGTIIGLAGPAGSGKDTVYQMIYDLYEEQFITTKNKKIVKEYHEHFVNKKFAGVLKEICSLLTGYPIETFYNREKYNDIIPGLDFSIRELMQRVGDGLREVIDNTIWVRAIFSKIRLSANVVITDVRYPNEAKVIREHKGILIKINRNHKEETLVGEQANHSSETALNDFTDYNYLINNNGSLDDLKLRVKEIMYKEGLIWQ